MPHDDLSTAAAPVVAVLEASGFDHLAGALRAAAGAGDAERVAQMCHARWLGDLNVPSMTWLEWLTLLADLDRHARRAR